jgi:hypothetical protein
MIFMGCDIEPMFSFSVSFSFALLLLAVFLPELNLVEIRTTLPESVQTLMFAICGAQAGGTSGCPKQGADENEKHDIPRYG